MAMSRANADSPFTRGRSMGGKVMICHVLRFGPFDAEIRRNVAAGIGADRHHPGRRKRRAFTMSLSISLAAGT